MIVSLHSEIYFYAKFIKYNMMASDVFTYPTRMLQILILLLPAFWCFQLHSATSNFAEHYFWTGRRPRCHCCSAMDDQDFVDQVRPIYAVLHIPLLNIGWCKVLYYIVMWWLCLKSDSMGIFLICWDVYQGSIVSSLFPGCLDDL
jgi:hypothetical protein